MNPLAKFFAGLSTGAAAGAAAAAAAIGTLLVMLVFDAVFDDPGVRREARAGFVAEARLQEAEAKAETAEKLLALEKQRALRAATERTAYALAARQHSEAAGHAELKQQELEDALQAIRANRDGPVPSVRDLGVSLRN